MTNAIILNKEQLEELCWDFLDNRQENGTRIDATPRQILVHASVCNTQILLTNVRLHLNILYKYNLKISRVISWNESISQKYFQYKEWQNQLNERMAFERFL